ncbi:MAG TPA: D-alanyl-D-alanine carboxypeptidase/D-alanyl-D-alanine-endopeptidase, partial [Bacteroidota bacterium]|nr:D-alanyl-D-alanine carboxypeptidase/D-alanyl-D-alanine-endopeptidase [Bacteroidota bacterium]
YVRDSILYGNLYVKGGGDPDFSSAAIAAIVAEQKSKAGIKRVEGELVGDDTYFDAQRWGTGWMWDDEPWGYAAFNSALSINRNCVDVYVRPSDTVGALPFVTIEPDTRYVSVENTAVTAGMNTKNTLDISRKFFERSNTITICGALPLGTSASHETITVLHPEQYFLTLMREEIERAGIPVSGRNRVAPVPSSAFLGAEYHQPIDSTIVYMNKESDNLSAENLLKTISAEVQGGNGSTGHGITLVKQTLAGFGIDSTSYIMVDGSGLSYYDLLSSGIFVKLLQGVATQKNIFDLFYASLPVAGTDGTLASRMRGTAAQGNLHAKTGTISGVSTLAGYVTTADGEMLAFSMMMQNFIGSAAPFRHAQDAIGAFMASYKRPK